VEEVMATNTATTAVGPVTTSVVAREKKLVSSMAEIEAKIDVEYKFIPGWSEEEELCLGSLTAGDLIEWSEANEGEAKRTAGLRLITKSLCGPEPEYVRFANDPKNIAVFRRKNHKITERIVKEILSLNGMLVKGDSDVKKD
jgi:hypothetical protein